MLDIICKLYNRGICKRINTCKFIHPIENCEILTCKGVNCKKRHPKPCMFFLFDKNCKYKDKCLFKEENCQLKLDLDKLKQEISELKKQNDLNIKEIGLSKDKEKDILENTYKRKNNVLTNELQKKILTISNLEETVKTNFKEISTLKEDNRKSKNAINSLEEDNEVFEEKLAEYKLKEESWENFYKCDICENECKNM